ncbi:Homeobox domain-containing protein [Trichostrongylus colubriformis]|uniref:Homeobox domain-containing protein n=1 Tax=Trichostrongylus colubriformis TaxID=6319 RepID=A0AAN8EXQ6_TRICO
MESGQCTYPPTVGILDELPWMQMPPAAYYAYPLPTNGQAGYPMTMQHPLPYSSMANWYGYNTNGMQPGGKYKKKRNLFTKLQLNMLQRRFAEKEHIRQPERDNFAQMIGLTGEQVKIWFQNQRYKRKHRDSGSRNGGMNGSSGANTSTSSLSSPSPRDSPDSEKARRNEIQHLPLMHQEGVTGPAQNPAFQQTQNYSQVYWGPQMAYYSTPPTFAQQNYNSEKLSLSSSSENDLDL